jgi:hypothetical protein
MGVRFTGIPEEEGRYLRKLVRGDGSIREVPEVDLDATLHMAS